MWFDIVEIFSLKKFENWVYKNYLQSISKLKDEIISILREIERQLLCQNILENFNKRSDACRLKEVLWEILFLDKFHKWFFNYRMNSNYVFISFLKNAESSCLFFNCFRFEYGIYKSLIFLLHAYKCNQNTTLY